MLTPGIAAPPKWGRQTTFRPDGTGELQTYFPSLGENAQSQLAREYSHRRQFLRLIGKILLRWLASLILSIAMVVAFYQYEKVKILDTKAKRWFNAVSTGLYLTVSSPPPPLARSCSSGTDDFPLQLGLNLAASLKGMAIIIRWKLLARKRHALEEVCSSILSCPAMPPRLIAFFRRWTFCLASVRSSKCFATESTS